MDAQNALSAPGTRPSRSRIGYRTGGASRWIEAGLIVLALALFLGPLLLVFMSAFKTTAEVTQEPLALPTSLHWENFIDAWTVGRFGSYIGNTIVYTVGTVAGGCILASLAGYALARIQFPGRGAVFIALILGLMVPFQSIMIPLYYTLLDLSLLGTYQAMILSGIALSLPFGVFIMRAFFSTLDESLAEAARLDGAGEWSVFWRVMLPLAGPGVATLAIFLFLGTWNSFTLPLIAVPTEELRPVAMGLVFFKSKYTQDIAGMCSAIVLMNIPVFLGYVILQRQFIRGVTAGATQI